MCTLHDENVNATCREVGPGYEGLIIKLNVTGVENGGADLAFQLYATAA